MRKESPVRAGLLFRAPLRPREVLQGPDGDDRVVGSRGPVIHPALQPHRDPGVGPPGNALRLIPAQRQPHGLPHPVFADEPAQRRAPAASYVENALRIRGAGMVDVIVHLANLGRLEIAVGVPRFPERAGVAEGVVEPEPVEVSSNIVMTLNGFRRSAAFQCVRVLHATSLRKAWTRQSMRARNPMRSASISDRQYSRKASYPGQNAASVLARASRVIGLLRMRVTPTSESASARSWS